MAHQEKRAWTMLVVSAVVYAVYVAVVLGSVTKIIAYRTSFPW